MNKNRLSEIDSAKGLGIILVVIGHVVSHYPPPVGNDWFWELRAFIYNFHMPFFLFISGTVMSYSYRPVTGFKGYINYVYRRFIRLMPAFFVLAVLILAGKIYLSPFMEVDNQPKESWNDFYDILVYPLGSSAGALWYVYALFLYNLLFPIFSKLAGNLIWPWLLVGLAAHFIAPDLPKTFMINRLADYFIFLAVGIIVGRNYIYTMAKINRFGPVFLILFFLLSCIYKILPERILLLGLLSIPAMMYLFCLPSFRDSNLLIFFGKNVFIIYLMNTLVIGFVKGIAFKFATWDGYNFYVYLPVLIFCGLFLPALLKKHVFSKIKVLNAITG